MELTKARRGTQEHEVWAAADALMQEGLRPTIDRVRQKARKRLAEQSQSDDRELVQGTRVPDGRRSLGECELGRG